MRFFGVSVLAVGLMVSGCGDSTGTNLCGDLDTFEVVVGTQVVFQLSLIHI